MCIWKYIIWKKRKKEKPKKKEFITKNFRNVGKICQFIWYARTYLSICTNLKKKQNVKKKKKEENHVRYSYNIIKVENLKLRIKLSLFFVILNSYIFFIHINLIIFSITFCFHFQNRIFLYSFFFILIFFIFN